MFGGLFVGGVVVWVFGFMVLRFGVLILLCVCCLYCLSVWWLSFFYFLLIGLLHLLFVCLLLWVLGLGVGACGFGCCFNLFWVGFCFCLVGVLSCFGLGLVL